MARKSNLIGTTETGNLSALGNAQQRDYNFVKNLLNRDDLIKYFAEPSVQENQEKIDWYSDTRGKIIGFQDFTASQVQRARVELKQLTRELTSLASRAENQVDRQAIKNLSVLPDTDSIKMVGDQITIINWAYRLHKRAKGSRQSANFAGFAEPDSETDEITETIADIGEDQTKVPKEDNPDQTINYDNVAEEIVSTADNDESQNSPPKIDPEVKKSRSSIKPSMFNMVTCVLLSVFFLLVILILILLKDACGVEGLPFLYFC